MLCSLLSYIHSFIYLFGKCVIYLFEYMCVYKVAPTLTKSSYFDWMAPIYPSILVPPLMGGVQFWLYPSALLVCYFCLLFYWCITITITITITTTCTSTSTILLLLLLLLILHQEK